MNAQYDNNFLGQSENKSEPLNEDCKLLIPFDYEITDSKDTSKNNTKKSLVNTKRQFLN